MLTDDGNENELDDTVEFSGIDRRRDGAIKRLDHGRHRRKIDVQLHEWKSEISGEVRARVAELIDLADGNVLDVARSRAVQQEVRDLLDEPASR